MATKREPVNLSSADRWGCTETKGVLFDMDRKYFITAIYCIFKEKRKAGNAASKLPCWILLRFPLFPRYGSPRQQPIAFLLILPPLDFSAVLCSGCNCIWATSAQCTYAIVALAGSKVLQERRRSWLQCLKNRPVFKPRLVSARAPLNTSTSCVINSWFS